LPQAGVAAKLSDKPMPKIPVALLALMLTSGVSLAQECSAPMRGAEKADSSNYALLFRAQAGKIVIGRHFALDIVVCAKNGPAPASLAVDAFMPAHQHGMNYKPVVKALGNGRFEADGLMLHMPGVWEFRFDIERDGRTERLTRSINLR
jgi:hypothetical protein